MFILQGINFNSAVQLIEFCPSELTQNYMLLVGKLINNIFYS